MSMRANPRCRLHVVCIRVELPSSVGETFGKFFRLRIQAPHDALMCKSWAVELRRAQVMRRKHALHNQEIGRPVAHGNDCAQPEPNGDPVHTHRIVAG